MVNTFLIQEDISKGQRIEDFTIEVFTNGAWRHVAEGTTVGYKRLVRFSDSKAEKLRVTVNALAEQPIFPISVFIMHSL